MSSPNMHEFPHPHSWLSIQACSFSRSKITILCTVLEQLSFVFGSKQKIWNYTLLTSVTSLMSNQVVHCKVWSFTTWSLFHWNQIRSSCDDEDISMEIHIHVWMSKSHNLWLLTCEALWPLGYIVIFATFQDRRKAHRKQSWAIWIFKTYGIDIDPTQYLKLTEKQIVYSLCCRVFE